MLCGNKVFDFKKRTRAVGFAQSWNRSRGSVWREHVAWAPVLLPPPTPSCPRGSPGQVSRDGPWLRGLRSPTASRGRAHPGERSGPSARSPASQPDATTTVPSPHPRVLDPGTNPLLPVRVAHMVGHVPLLWHCLPWGRLPGGAEPRSGRRAAPGTSASPPAPTASACAGLAGPCPSVSGEQQSLSRCRWHGPDEP